MSKIISLIIILIIALCFYFNFPQNTKSYNQKIANHNFSLEIANTPSLQSKGLSKRNNLCPNCGMLFVFNQERIQSFWMKDTLIPLDMIFIDTKGKVTDIYTAQPETNKSDFQLTIFKSSLPTKFVIELNAHKATLTNLKVGDTININL